MYLIQSLVNDQNWVCFQRYGATETVNSSYHLTNYQQMLGALLMHKIIKWAYSGTITWHNYKKSCFHSHCEKIVMQNHWQETFKQHWSSRFTAAHKSFIFHLTITKQTTAYSSWHCFLSRVFCKGREQHPFLDKGNSTCPRTSCRSLSGSDSIIIPPRLPKVAHYPHRTLYNPITVSLSIFFSNKNTPFLPRLILCHEDDTIQEDKTNMQTGVTW